MKIFTRILFLFVAVICFQSCDYSRASTKTIDTKDYYSEQYRPQYHFSPEANWMNDPNGMVYLDGEYHLFYQYYPDSTVWGPMHWGHAVSKDLMHWEHLPIALFPDELGCIFSGSAVYDKNNTSGLGKNGKGPLIAIFTHHNFEGEKSGNNKFQYQSIAYSNDKGRSWKKYKNNPVVPNPGIRDFRDPKVIWHEESQKWIMTFAAWDHVKFYSSPNLIDWEHESDFGQGFGNHEGVWECPDLIPMPMGVKESDGKEKVYWVLLVSIGSGGPNGGSATQYFVGHFDGHEYTLEPSFEYLVTPKYGKQAGGKIIFDFEDEKEYVKDWTFSGNAFGVKPVQGSFPNQNRVTNYTGLSLVNSFLNGDPSTGEMRSKTFKIDQPFLNIKVGGGNDISSTYVALVVNGKEVRKHTGENAEKLKWKSWEVKQFQGEEAFIKIIDQKSDDWGHILVDEIMLSDEAAIDGPDPAKWVDWGKDNYAGVTWSNAPDQRRIFLGWMSNWQYAQEVPTEKWRSAMTLPRELDLKHYYVHGWTLSSKPVKEIEGVFGKSKKLEAKTYLTNTAISDELTLAKIDLEYSNPKQNSIAIKLSNSHGEHTQVGFDNSSHRFYIDRNDSGKINFNENFGGTHRSDSVALIGKFDMSIFLDHSSIELFALEGRVVITDIVFPTVPYNKIELIVEDGSAELLSGKITELESVWK